MDVHLPPHAQEGARNMRGTLNRALKLLADDLYSTETHFVLELIQNADDNAYPAGAVPEVTFSLEAARLTVANNETGFTSENVRALCDARKRTKSKREGFIGEKGIGFKSVFAVSDRPEIHSSGFHFRFDASGANPLGYVVSEWLSGCSEQSGTRIVLPEKHGQSFTSDQRDGASLVAERRDDPNGVTLTSQTTPEFFAEPVVSKTSYLVARDTV